MLVTSDGLAKSMTSQRSDFEDYTHTTSFSKPQSTEAFWHIIKLQNDCELDFIIYYYADNLRNIHENSIMQNCLKQL